MRSVSFVWDEREITWSMNVEIFGEPGPKFDRLKELAYQVAGEMGIDVEIGSVRDTAEIVRKGILWTPALVVDGEVKCSGRIPSLCEIRAFLS